MKTVFKLTITSLLLCMMAMTAFASTTPDEMHISCTAPNPAHQTGLHRTKGDSNVWTFSIVLDGNAHFVTGPFWSYPGKGGGDPDWGLWTGGGDGDSSLGWSSPEKTGDFQVRVSGQIGCGNGPGGHPIDFSAGWDGSVDFNADIKVKRSGTDDSAYSSSATVAAGGLGSSEHKADVQVTATDSDGNPMSGISVPAPTIQNGDGVSASAGILPSSVTTDSDGKANFTFTSSDKVINVTLEEDGGESSASVSVDQHWADDGSWDYDEYFDYDTPSDITFNMAFTDSGTIPITEHTVSFVNTEIDGWEWNPDDEDYEYIFYPEGDIPEEYDDLVTYGDITESPLGSYTTQQTIYLNDDFLVDSVSFDVVDGNTFGDSN